MISIVDQVKTVYEVLHRQYPDITTFLNYGSPFQLLVAVILSAQCTDERVNQVTPSLFATFPTSEVLAKADVQEVRNHIQSVNYFNQKAKYIIQMSQQLELLFDGQVPDNMESLLKLSGVGRKSASVILGAIFQKPAITVDTHVKRVTFRMGWHSDQDADSAEFQLRKIWPELIWFDMSSVLIMHGRHTCKARKPDCANCEFQTWCPTSV